MEHSSLTVLGLLMCLLAVAVTTMVLVIVYKPNAAEAPPSLATRDTLVVGHAAGVPSEGSGAALSSAARSHALARTDNPVVPNDTATFETLLMHNFDQYNNEILSYIQLWDNNHFKCFQIPCATPYVPLYHTMKWHLGSGGDFWMISEAGTLSYSYLGKDACGMSSACPVVGGSYTYSEPLPVGPNPLKIYVSRYQAVFARLNKSVNQYNGAVVNSPPNWHGQSLDMQVRVSTSNSFSTDTRVWFSHVAGGEAVTVRLDLSRAPVSYFPYLCVSSQGEQATVTFLGENGQEIKMADGQGQVITPAYSVLTPVFDGVSMVSTCDVRAVHLDQMCASVVFTLGAQAALVGCYSKGIPNSTTGVIYPSTLSRL